MSIGGGAVKCGGSIKRKPGWDILDVFPIRALDLEVADVPLSVADF